MKIRFTRGCFVKGNPYEVGQVDEFSDPLSKELIAMGSAVPVNSNRESASVKPAAEKATLPTEIVKKKAAKKSAKK